MFDEIELRLPKLVGTRGRAEQIASELASDLSSSMVTVDCADVLSGAQGFTDELCKQILEVRGARELKLVAPPASMAEYALRSARLRKLEGLKITDRL